MLFLSQNSIFKPKELNYTYIGIFSNNNLLTSLPLAMFHIIQVLSEDVEANSYLSSLIQTESTTY